MKFTYQWLQEYCSFKLPPSDELAHLLTMHGVKVEHYRPINNNDAYFELEITANRPDCLSVLGVSREVAVITRQDYQPPRLKTLPQRPAKAAGSVKNIITIENTEDCPVYIARVIKNVRVAPSPEWLKKKVADIGLRSVNNIVDITNYVMFEYGEPMHAFDLDRLAPIESGLAEKRIVVRRAKPSALGGEKIVALDGKTYQLTSEMLVIADAREPVAIAGIMGGQSTEVNEQTTNLLLETAYFNPSLIRKTARRLNLSSDSSYRFERGVAPSVIAPASRRAIQLITELAGGEVTEQQIINLLKTKEKTITLRFKRVAQILGCPFQKSEIKRILKGLGFNRLSESAAGIKIKIPDFRNDINAEIDLIEEIARIRGYEQIPTTPPVINLKVEQKNKVDEITELIRPTLAGLAYNEIMTSSFMEEKYQPDFTFWSEQKLIGLLGPEGMEDRFLRNSLCPVLLLANKTNEASERERVIQLFEMAKIYSRPGQEKLMLGLLDNQGFYSLKGTLNALWIKLNLVKNISYHPVQGEINALDSKKMVAILMNTETIGYSGELSPEARGKYETQKNVAVAEIDLEKIISQSDASAVYREFPRQPAIQRDLAVVVDEKIKWEEIKSAVQSKGGSLLESVRFFDLYRGKQVPSHQKSLAFSLYFRHPDRTLTNEEADKIINEIITTLQKQFNATLRT
ncbi:MAG: phenylalanine--tRNA ligase subunit beta [Planctomycetota bacterium]